MVAAQRLQAVSGLVRATTHRFAPKHIDQVSSSRLCSTGSSTRSEHLKEFLVLVPDYPNSLPVRMETKAAHMQGAMPLINDGRLTYFGVTLAKHADASDASGEINSPDTTPQLDINGSLMVIKAADEQSVRNFLAEDAYTRSGVWDVAKASIIPFKGG